MTSKSPLSMAISDGKGQASSDFSDNLKDLLKCPRLKSCASYRRRFLSDQSIRRVDDPSNAFAFVGYFQCGRCNHKFHVCFSCRATFSSLNSKRNHCKGKHPLTLAAIESKSLPGQGHKRITGCAKMDDLDRTNSCVEDSIFHPSSASLNTELLGETDGFNGYVFDNNMDQPNVPGPPPVPPTISLLPEDFPFCRPASQNYFFHNQEKGGGIAYLAGKAGCELDNIEAGDIHPLEAKMIAQTAQLATDLGITNRNRLADLTNTVTEVVRMQTMDDLGLLDKHEQHDFHIRPICCPIELRSSIMEGQYAFVPNLPHPEPHECEGHAYCLPTDCLQDSLASGHDLEHLLPNGDGSSERVPEYPISQINGTSMCRCLFDINVAGTEAALQVTPIDIYLWLAEWSDDFEPNNSIKGNRGSVWIKTLTVSPRPGSRHKLLHTYPIAVGSKKADHEPLEDIVAANLSLLSSPVGVVMYSKSLGGLVRLRAKMFVSLQDQPERRGSNQLMAGNSIYHARFGYAAPWTDFKDVLRPCPECRSLLLDQTQEWTDPKCSVCTNWAIDIAHPLLFFPPPHLIPDGTDAEAANVSRDLWVPPIRLTYSGLRNAVQLSHQSYVTGAWEAEKARQYLRCYCIRTSTIDAIMQQADNCKQYQDVIDDPQATAIERLAVIAEAEKDPLLWVPWPIPAFWRRGVDLVQHPDVPMHLLFLGVVKTVVQRVETWMSNKGKSTAFVEETQEVLRGIEDLNLSWCKVQPFTGGKFGGWVSENFLGLSRLLKWLYSRMDEVASDKEPFVEPNLPLNKWLAPSLKGWLKARKLPHDGLKAYNLGVVAEYYRCLTEEGKPLPEIVDEPAGPVQDVLLTLESLDDLMALLMVESIEDESYYVNVERTIRVFLTHFADMDEKLKRKSESVSWLSSYNFLSLLNLPDIIREYGPLRLIWEGGSMGEGFLRFVKPNINQGLRKGWERSTLQTLLREKAMASIMWDELGPSSRLEGRLYQKNYHVYEKEIAALPAMLQRASKPISAVGYEDGRYGIIATYLEEPKFLPLVCHDPNIIKCGRDYLEWRLEELEENQQFEEHDYKRVTSHLLLLPLLQGNRTLGDPGYETNVFSVIMSDHNSISIEEDEPELGLPID
jgi:hypothetical protein